MNENSSRSTSIRRQGRYWMLTIARGSWTPHLPEICSYIKGQAEIGEETGYEHWQVLAVTKRKTSLSGIKRGIEAEGNGDGIHGELTRSSAANEYVWKEHTRVAGTQFEFGIKNLIKVKFLFIVMTKLIGIESGKKRKRETSKTFPVTFDFDITVPFEQSHLIMQDLLDAIDDASSSGVRLVLESHTEHSLKREKERTLKVQQLSSGTATRVRNTLSWMNFEEQSLSSTYLDGLISIHAWWKLKDQLHHLEHPVSGSPQTSNLKNGTPTSTVKHSVHFEDVSQK